MNETAKLDVKFTGVPKTSVTWLKADGTEIKPNDRIHIVTDDNGQSTLIIDNATSQDIQSYTARATNKVGVIDAKINLNVKGKIDIDSQRNLLKFLSRCFLFIRSKTNIKK